MRIRCEDHWHHLSPTAMAIVIEALQEGELIGSKSGKVQCISYAFTPDRVRKFYRLYKGNIITFEGEPLNEEPPRSRRIQHR